MLKAAGFPPI